MVVTDYAKKLIAATFKELVTTGEAVEKIRVLDIISKSGISRATFYYHFVDKMDLMIWIFRSELATALQKVFAEEQLISDSEIPDDRHNGLPFYIDQRTPERDLNISQFWYIFCTYFNENLEYYRKCFEYKGQNSLHEYYFKLYRTQIRKDILSQIDPATASPGFLEHAIFFYTNANFGYLLQCLESGEPLPVVYDYSDPLCNLGHELMKYALRTYQH